MYFCVREHRVLFCVFLLHAVSVLTFLGVRLVRGNDDDERDEPDQRQCRHHAQRDQNGADPGHHQRPQWHKAWLSSAIKLKARKIINRAFRRKQDKKARSGKKRLIIYSVFWGAENDNRKGQVRNFELAVQSLDQIGRIKCVFWNHAFIRLQSQK